MSASRAPILLEAEFSDMGQYGAALGWDLDFRQLEAGPLKAGLRAFAAGSCTGIAFHFNKSFHQLGQAPQDMLCFGLPGSGQEEFRFCGAEVRSGSLLNFNLSSGFDSITLSDFHGHVLLFERERLQELANSMRLAISLDRLAHTVSAWDSPASRRLCRQLEKFYPAVAPVAEAGNHGSDLLEEELGLSILQILGDKGLRSVDDDITRHARILERSLYILSDFQNLPISVTQLCLRVGSSLSTLNRIFTARFDVTPKAYIRSRCLSATRDELSASTPETRVSDVANRWGFWHMGQFARDYRAMFGELPSATLKKPNRDQSIHPLPT